MTDDKPVTSERILSTIDTSGYMWEIGINDTDIIIRIDETDDPIYVTKTEAGMLSLALRKAIEEFTR